jgi:hypothetical protein
MDKKSNCSIVFLRLLYFNNTESEKKLDFFKTLWQKIHQPVSRWAQSVHIWKQWQSAMLAVFSNMQFYKTGNMVKRVNFCLILIGYRNCSDSNVFFGFSILFCKTCQYTINEFINLIAPLIVLVNQSEKIGHDSLYV